MGVRRYEEHQAHFQFTTTRSLLARFRSEHPDCPCSLGKFQALKPYYIKKGKQNTCLCRY